MLFSLSRYLKVCLDFLVMYKNSLIRKTRLISELMRSKPGKQIIVIHTLSNFLRIKGNQRIESSQLKQCNMTNIFLENSYTKCGEETIPRPFFKKKIKIEHISGSFVYSFIQFVLIGFQVEGYQNILKLSCIPLALPQIKPLF